MSGRLRVEGVGKAYRKWGSEWLRVASWFSLPAKPVEEHWVLRDINFEIEPGESVAIIGQNGAGKSTLLKLIAGTVAPSIGRVEMAGKVAAILELGMGFNPDFTARQNVRHVAGLMGHEDVEEKMAEIEAFAEVGEYFDQPIRTYSSGMQMRVAFAVVTAWRPDVLIVDEALSVGDSYFQHKSFDRIRQLKREGTTLLFVSHSMGSVRELCDRAILLADGKVLKDGLPDEVADYYNAMVAEKENAKLSMEQKRDKDGWLLTRSGTGEVKVAEIGLFDAQAGGEVNLAKVGQDLVVRLKAQVHANVEQLVLGLMIRDKLGHVVWGTNTWHTHQILPGLRTGDVVEYEFPFACTLGPGSYSVSPALVSTDTHLVDNYDWVDNLLVFDVANMDHPLFIGTSWLDSRFVMRVNGEKATGIHQAGGVA